MELATPTCPVCWEEFNLLQRLPRITLVCGHSVCTDCLIRLLKSSNNPKCPVDNLPLPKQVDHKKFPVNYALQTMLEQKKNKEFCQTHNNKMRFLCITDGVKICSICLETEHHGHQIRAFETIKSQSNKQRKQVRDVIQEMKDSHQKLKKMVEDERLFQWNRIENEFNKIRRFIDSQEKSAKFNAISCFMIEEQAIEGLLGTKSALYKDLSNEETKLENALKHDEFLKDNDFLLKSQSIVDKARELTDFKRNSDNLEKVFKRIDGAFEDYFTRQQLNLEHLDLDADISLEHFKIQSYLTFEYNTNSCLIIENSCFRLSEVTLDLSKWIEARSIKLNITNIVQEIDFQLINHVWKSLKNPCFLSLQLASGTLTEDLYNMLISSQFSFMIIKIDIKGYDLKNNPQAISLIQKIFSKAQQIKIAYLSMEEVKIPADMQKALEGIRLNPANLEELCLNFNSTNIVDKELSPLFVKMPKLKKLFLYLDNTKITDEALIECAKSTLASMEALEALYLSVFGTAVTDKGMQHVLKDLKNTQDIVLELNNTGITSETLYFFRQVFGASDSIRRLELNFPSIKLANEKACNLFLHMPSLAQLVLGLSYSSISDEEITVFTKSLEEMKSLENLTLCLIGTEMSQDAWNQLLQNLKDVKSLELDLRETNVNNEAIESFARHKLLKMNNLRDLKVTLSKEKIRLDLVEEIDEVAKNFQGTGFVQNA